MELGRGEVQASADAETRVQLPSVAVVVRVVGVDRRDVVGLGEHVAEAVDGIDGEAAAQPACGVLQHDHRNPFGRRGVQQVDRGVVGHAPDPVDVLARDLLRGRGGEQRVEQLVIAGL